MPDKFLPNGSVNVPGRRLEVELRRRLARPDDSETNRVRVCYYHEDRSAIGICMHCRVPICAVCTTRLQGINYCHKCLAALAARKDETKFNAGPLVAACVLVIGVSLLFGVCWLLQGALAP